LGLTSHFKAIIFVDVTSDILVDNYKHWVEPAASSFMKKSEEVDFSEMVAFSAQVREVAFKKL
jgi:hypothetical protein